MHDTNVSLEYPCTGSLSFYDCTVVPLTSPLIATPLTLYMYLFFHLSSHPLEALNVDFSIYIIILSLNIIVACFYFKKKLAVLQRLVLLYKGGVNGVHCTEQLDVHMLGVATALSSMTGQLGVWWLSFIQYRYLQLRGVC